MATTATACGGNDDDADAAAATATATADHKELLLERVSGERDQARPIVHPLELRLRCHTSGSRLALAAARNGP